MPWELFAIISIVTTSIAALLERVLMKDDSSDPISFAIIFQLLLGIVTWCFALIFGKFILPHDSSVWFRYLISAVLWAGATVASLKAMKLLPVAEATIIGSSGTIISILFGVLFFKEKIVISTIFGTILIFSAILIVFSENLSFKSKSGIFLALLSALFGATAVINDMIILKSYEAFSYTTIMSLLPGFVLLFIFPKHLFNSRNLFNKKMLRTMVFLAIFYSIQAITYYLAIEQKAPISKLSPITKSSIILTVLFGAIFLKERSHVSKKILAAVVVTLGVILIG
ncbi:MAG: DMT family transporter [Candidatus Shapirobacteria bacterium]